MPKDVGRSTSKQNGRGKSKQTTPKVKRPVGRPSSYMSEVADDICMLLAQGESLRKICERPGMPSQPTVFKWLNENEQFLKQYTRAREAQTENMLEEMFNIADSADPENVQVAKLQIETRKWAMSKLAPKKYGNKQEMDITSSDGTMTMPTVIQLVAPSLEQSDE